MQLLRTRRGGLCSWALEHVRLQWYGESPSRRAGGLPAAASQRSVRCSARCSARCVRRAPGAGMPAACDKSRKTTTPLPCCAPAGGGSARVGHARRLAATACHEQRRRAAGVQAGDPQRRRTHSRQLGPAASRRAALAVAASRSWRASWRARRQQLHRQHACAPAAAAPSRGGARHRRPRRAATAGCGCVRRPGAAAARAAGDALDQARQGELPGPQHAAAREGQD